MKTPENKVLIIPPRPPSPMSTVTWAVGGLALSIAANVTYFAVKGFPETASLEKLFAWAAIVIMFNLSFILGMRAVINETKRNQFHHIVTTYTNMTGDKRYIPYLLPVRTQLVSAVFGVSMIISFLLPFVDMTNHAK